MVVTDAGFTDAKDTRGVLDDNLQLTSSRIDRAGVYFDGMV